MTLNHKKLTAAILFAISSHGDASVIYEYKGNLLLDDSGLILQPVTAQLTFSDDGLTLLDWNIGQPNVGTYTKAGTPPSPYITMSIMTDENGAVAKWDLYAFNYANGVDVWGGYSHVSTSTGYTSSNGAEAELVEVRNGALATVFYASNYDTPGSWESNGTLKNLNFVLPPVVPEASSYILFTAGLGYLGLYSLRRKKYLAP